MIHVVIHDVDEIKLRCFLHKLMITDKLMIKHVICCLSFSFFSFFPLSLFLFFSFSLFLFLFCLLSFPPPFFSPLRNPQSQKNPPVMSISPFFLFSPSKIRISIVTFEKKTSVQSLFIPTLAPAVVGMWGS